MIDHSEFSWEAKVLKTWGSFKIVFLPVIVKQEYMSNNEDSNDLPSGIICMPQATSKLRSLKTKRSNRARKV